MFVMLFRDGISQCGVYLAAFTLLDKVDTGQQADVSDTVTHLCDTLPQLKISEVNQFYRSLGNILSKATVM